MKSRPSAPDLPPFWTLVEAHGGELLKHARRLVGDDAEDVLQEALLRALRSYPRLDHADHLRAWLYRITTTTAYDHGGRARREIPMDAPPEGSVFHPNEGAVFQPENDGFEALIHALPEGPRSVLYMRFVEDLSYVDIAQRLDCSEVAARQRVSSAVRKLRGELT
ncbi:MAG: RNA polymerase sigma factor [Actinomycetota bacterium]